MQIGEKFSRLTVVAPSDRERYCVCECSCGRRKEVRKDHLLNGKTLSCGCLAAEQASARAHVMRAVLLKHGKSHSRVYSIWHGMHQRCGNKNTAHYDRYGGRGIAVCERWSSFENFYADMGDPPAGYTIERKDNDVGYSPENCIWADRKTQSRNRAISRIVEWDGQSRTIAEWAVATGIHHNTITGRIDKGWPLELVFSSGKHINLAGLALGAKASQFARLARPACSKGHEYSEESSYWNGKQRVCRICHADRQRARRDAGRK